MRGSHTWNDEAFTERFLDDRPDRLHHPCIVHILPLHPPSEKLKRELRYIYAPADPHSSKILIQNFEFASGKTARVARLAVGVDGNMLGIIGTQ